MEGRMSFTQQIISGVVHELLYRAIALDEAVMDGRIKRGQYVLLMGFGGGLSWGYNLIKW